MSHLFQGIHEERKGPFRICTALNVEIPFISQSFAESSLDMFPTSESTVVHECKTTIRKGMTVIFAETTFGGGSDVSED